jgi:DNA-binding SARP family transcriptional activator
MQLRILGPVEARDELGAVVQLGGPKPRAVLAMLALESNAWVSADRLARGLWGDEAPADSVRTVHVHVSRLRKALGDGARLETRGASYRLVIDERELDFKRFHERVARGREAFGAGRFDEASASLAEALREWRGAPLADLVREPFAAAWISSFEEERIEALECRFAAELAAGRHEALVADLRRTVAAHPTHEPFTEQLMLALHRCARQTDALDAYGALKRALDHEDREPSAALRRLRAGVLSGDRALDFTPRAVVASPPPLSPLLPLTSDEDFVGRADLLDALRSRWEQVRKPGGRSQLVLLSGPAGVGKTRLVCRFANETHAAGGAVLLGRADPEAVAVFQPVSEALQHLVKDGGELAGDVADELSILAGAFPWVEAEPAAGRGSQEAMFHAVGAVLEAAAERWPLMLVLDDLHWADVPTLRLLRHVVQAVAGTRILVVGTYRDEEVADDHPLKARRADDRIVRLALSGLEEAETRALVDVRLRNGGATQEFVRKLHRATEGNALFIEETLRALHESGRSGAMDATALDALGLPAGVAEVILRRVRALPALAMEALTVGAVIGPRFSLGTLKPLVGAGEDALLDVIEECCSARLVVEAAGEVFAFSHDRVRTALYERLTMTRRLRLHLRVARTLATSEDPNPAELARHYQEARRLAGTGLGDEDIRAGLESSIEAGRQAARQFAYGAAIKQFDEALEFCGDGDEKLRCDILLQRGRAEFHFGADPVPTFVAVAESAEGRDAKQLAYAALGLGDLWFEATYAGDVHVHWLEKALAALGPADDTLRALVLGRLAVNLGYPSESERALEYSERAVGLAREAVESGGRPSLLGAVLVARQVALLDARHIDKRLEIRGIETTLAAHPELEAEHHQWRMYDLLGVGERDRAREQLDQLEAIARRLRQPLLLALATGALGLFAELDGDFEQADRYAEGFRTFAEAARMRDAESSWASQVFTQRRREGRVSEMEASVRQLMTTGGHQLGWRACWGLLCFETGNEEGARRAFERELAGGPDKLPRGMFRLTRLALLSELCAMLGDAERARQLYAVLEPFSALNVVVAYCTVLGPVDGFLALLAETYGDMQRASEHTARALDGVRKLRAPVLAVELERRSQALAV